jgi:hypothetical protein
VSKNPQSTPLARLITRIPANDTNTRQYQVLLWCDDKVSGGIATITMVAPREFMPDAPEFMPLSVCMNDECRELVTLWERDWGYGFPYLRDIGDEIVIAVMQDGFLVEVVPIRDKIMNKERGTEAMLNLKAETAHVMGVGNLFFRTQLEKQFEAHMHDRAAAPATPVATATMVEKTVAAAPVVKAEQLAAHRADVAFRPRGVHQLFDEVPLQLYIRIQGQNPIAPARGNRLILSRGEAGIPPVPDKADPPAERRQSLDRIVV